VTRAAAGRSAGRPGLRALDRKLLRDLWAIRGQALAIALVIAAGTAIFVAMFSTFDSLDLTLRTYYDRYRFADVFASLKRAPLSLAGQIERLPGVAQVETRVVVDVTLDVPGLSEPAVGRLISTPAGARAGLCDVFLRGGRLIEPGRPDEVLASEGFARAHHLEPGDTIGAIVNGRRRELRIVGLALSPEYVYTIRPGELFPDEARFGILWMERRALASAFQMDGAFNDVVLKLMHGASDREVTTALDRVLAPYGGVGAIPRALQTSAWYLSNELVQLRTSGTIIPVVFLGVAAFLLNVVLTRIVAVQRPQIAAVKALGYSNGAIAAHYVKWSLVVALAGGLLGVAVGAWLGWAFTRMYTLFFHFPLLLYSVNVQVVVGGIAIGLTAAVTGALGAVRRAVLLPPAEALRPEAPASFSESWAERLGAKRLLSQPARIILRTLQRHPGRVALSIVGIALGASLLVVGNFSLDSVDLMLDTQFNLAQRNDAMVTLVEPSSASALDELRRLPGVTDAEPFRAVPVRLRSGPRFRYVAISGIPERPRLNRVIDASRRVVEMPADGLVLSAKLAQLLGVGRGDPVTVEVLEGRRVTRTLAVADLVDEYMGTNAYMDIDALHRLMEEGQTVSGAYLLVDRAAEQALYRRLKATPRVAGVMLRRAAIQSFQDTFSEMVRKIQVVYVLFAAVIAFGVVYNSARISLSERARELATLRVIGFTRAEISYVLLGELGLVSVVAVPLGIVLGYVFAALVAAASESEMYRIPLVVTSTTCAYAGTTILVATIVSAMIVRRRLDRLDLVEVLKTRE
jgi:putative ABC transport system permease protein